MEAVNPIYIRRRRRDMTVRWLCVGAALFGVTWLALILFTLVYNGFSGLNLQVFVENTPPPGSNEGGLRNAIVGSVIMTALGVGLWLSALNVQYRDVRYTIGFLTQFWLFATPVAYPSLNRAARPSRRRSATVPMP